MVGIDHSGSHIWLNHYMVKLSASSTLMTNTSTARRRSDRPKSKFVVAESANIAGEDLQAALILIPSPDWLTSCASAWGLGADGCPKALICLMSEGSTSGAYSQAVFPAQKKFCFGSRRSSDCKLLTQRPAVPSWRPA